MSFLINSFLLNQNAIASVENPVALSVPNGTAFGSLVFQSTIRARVASGFYREIPVSYSVGSYDGNTNGSYTLIGTLAPVAPIVNPNNLTVSIVVWVVPAPHSWLDLIDKSLVIGGTDNIDRITHQVTAKVNIGAIQFDANLVRRPSFNGEGSYFNTQSALKQAGTTADYAFLHDGTQFTFYVVWKQLTMSTTEYMPLMDSINAAGTAKGISLFVDNRSSITRVKRLVFQIARAINGQVPINLVSPDNAVLENAWNWCRISYNGTVVEMVVNGVSQGTQAPAFAMLTGNATNLLNYGNRVSVSTQTGQRAYIKHYYFENALITGGDLTLLDSWADAMCDENLIVEDANVYLRIGQSNQAGRGLSSGIAAELNGAVGASIMVIKSAAPTQTDGSGTVNSDSYWEELELGRNQTTENVATQHGMEMRFGYNMHQFNENCWIVKMGVGGTPIFSTATYNDWNVSSAQLYTKYVALTTVALDELIHVFRKNPVVRGLSIMQGETDALASLAGAGAQYKTNWTTFINTFIPAIEAAVPVTINKLRIYFWQISDAGGYAYDPTEFAGVQGAQIDMGANYLTDNPSMATKIKGVTTRTTDDIPFLDPQHYNATGLSTMAVHEFDYFKLYVLE